MAIDSFIFGGNTGLTYEQLKRRRAVALALASQRRGFPKTVGEGMTYLGESIGDMIAERRLDAAERGSAAYGANLRREIEGGAAAAPAPVIPSAAPRPPTAPRPALPSAPVRPPPPSPSRPQVSMVPVRPTPSDPYGATEGTGEGFEPGSILNPAPMTSDLTPPPGMRGDLYPSEGTPPSTLIPSTAAAPPPNLPAPTAAPPVNDMDLAVTPSPELLRAQEFQRSQGRPATGPAGAPAAAPIVPAASVGPQSGLTDFIAKQEGFRPSSYWDYKQHSIGFGTRGQPGETITREEGKRRLESEVANARQEVENFAPEAPPGVKDALTSLTYNAGSGWQQAGLGRLIKEGRYDEARERFLAYNKAGGSTLPGLVSRRNAELSSFWDQTGAAPDERLALERPLPQRGGEGMTLASYGSPNMRSDAPPPGIGSAGGNIRMRSDPFQPPAGPAAPAETEQVTPVDIEPMPPTAQLQAGQLGQLGPPVGRFSRSDAPVVGLPPATAVIPATGTPPAPAAPPVILPVGAGGQAPGLRPSQEPIPPATPQTMADPGAPPPPPSSRPMTDTQQKILRALSDPRLDPNGPDAASLKDLFGRHEAERQRLEKIDLSDYTSKREGWEKRVIDKEKFDREAADRNLKQQSERAGLEKTQADLEEKYYNQGLPRQQAADKARLEIIQKQQEIQAGKAPPHATMGEVPVQWDQATGTWREIDVQKRPAGEGPPTVKLTKEQSDELQHLTKVRIALDQYSRVRDADKILAEGLKDELAGRLPFFGNAALSEKYRVVRNAASNFLQGHLRSTSGAAIGAQEMATHYSSLVPLYGDDPVTIRNKQQQREGIAQGMYVGLGTARPLFDYTVAQRQKEDVAEQEKIRREMPTNPEVGKIYKNEKGRRRYWTGSRWEDD